MKHRYAAQIESDIRLGETYIDGQTGIEGIATAVFFYQYGCERVNLETLVNGEIKDYAFDAPRLVHKDTATQVETARTGGPGKGADPQRPVPASRLKGGWF